MDPQELSPPVTMTVYEMSQAIRDGKITSESAVQAYMDRIESFDDKGPIIQSIIATHPDALNEAKLRDRELQAGAIRGPLHGIPILLKDTIESQELPTTAGALALQNNMTGRDAPTVERLREAGAIILGKTNLSEWANFRSNRAIPGWSAVGGLTRNPHALDRSACGSSTSSAAAIAASFAPLALGTETNGSITCPAAMTGIVGFKPTVGLLSRRHVITISPRQDTVGPMAKTVQDAALMLSVMAATDEGDPATVEADARRTDYVSALEPDLSGLRIGVFRWAEGNNPFVSAAFNEALSVLSEQGAILVDINEFDPDPAMFRSGDSLLQTEFKASVNSYLADTPDTVKVRSLSALVDFNEENAARELALFDQSRLIAAIPAADPNDPDYLNAVTRVQNAARADGIDALLSDNDVQVLVMPSAKPATPIDITFSSRPTGGPLGASWLAAMAGYPSLSVPMGSHRGLPLGLVIVGTAWDDATVLRVGHHYQINSGVSLSPRYPTGPFQSEEYGTLMRPSKE
ncbi:MAG: amidase [Pseudomonadota bacterium]